jgi:predicted DNA-binding protein with PD1-like motif
MDRIHHKQHKYALKLKQSKTTGDLLLYQHKLHKYNRLEKRMCGGAEYVDASQAVPIGSAPGMKVQLLNQDHKTKTYAIIFKPGDEVFSGLSDFAKKYNVTSAHFTAIGALRKAKIGWFDVEKKAYKKLLFDQQCEIGSLIGNIALLDGQPVVHAHMTVGLSDGSSKSGHLLSGFVYPTVEVMMTVEPNAMHKKFNKEIGASLIQPGLAKL